jgi:Flp pilus assembly protein TadD
MIGGEEVAAGSYAVLSKPSATEWEVMFFPYESGSWGSYVEKTPAVTAKVKSMASEGKVEAFTIDVQNYTMEGADIVMKWDDTMVAVPVKTNAKKQIMASIDRIMAGPGMNDYYNAASFLHENGDKQKALEYINKAVSMGGDNPRYWMVRRQGLILADLGMNKKAMAAFEMSTKLAEKAGNMDYVRMNKKSMMSLN